MTDNDIGGGTPGGGIAAKMARHIAEAMINTRVKMGPHQNAVAQTVLQDFTNHVSDEIRGVMGPLWRKLADDPAMPEEMRALFHALGTQRGQAWAWIAGTSTSAALGGGLMALLTNYLNPVIHPLIRASPNGILSPETNAHIEARRAFSGWSPRRDAASGGIDDDVYNALVTVAQQQPTLLQLLEMRNRGVIDSGTMATALRRHGYPEHLIEPLIVMRFAELSMEQIASMWNRGIFPESEAIELGNRVGYNTQQVRRFLEWGGDPPPNDELLLAWRRGIITEAQVDRALRQSPLRFEWINVIKSLQWQPLPLSEAADAVNQNHLPLEKARRVAREHGVRDEDFDIYVSNAGIPPGPQMTLDWVNRGLLTVEEGLQALYESRIKNKWVPLYMESRHETMPPETIRLMYRRGALDQAGALRRLQARGYSPEDAAIILDGAIAEKTQGERDLSTAQVRELYADRIITRDDALAMLAANGYDEQEALFILELADLQRVRRFVTAATNRIKSAYVGGHIGETDAQTRLDALGVPAEFKEDVLALWDLERATVTRGLTPAQITAAVKKGFLEPVDGMRRLVGQGYSEGDAIILLQLAGAIG